MANLPSDNAASDVLATFTLRTGAEGADAFPDLKSLIGSCLCDGRFAVHELLGQGGQGAVFRVSRHDPQNADSAASAVAAPEQQRFIPRPLRTPQQAALKVFVPRPTQPNLTERTIAEYRVAARLAEG